MLRKIKAFIWVKLEEIFGELGYFFRHGIRQRFDWLRGFGKHQVKQAEAWRKSADARRKTAHVERRYAQAEVTGKLMVSRDALAGGIYSMLTSPVRFARWFIFKLGQLRKMSFREACAEIWFGYRGLIAWVLNHCVARLYRWADLSIWLRTISVIILLGALAGAAALPWAFDSLKRHRSQAIFTEAKALQEEGRLVEAYTKVRAAALLQRDDEELLAMTTELAKETRNPELVWWSELSAAAQGYDAESLADVVKHACRIGRIKVAAQAYQKMRKLHPEHPLTADAEIRLLMAQGRGADAMVVAEQAHASGNQSAAVQQMIREQLWGARDPASARRLVDYVNANLDQPGESGLMLAQMALAHPEPLLEGDFNFVQLIKRVQANPEAEPSDVALAFGRAFDAGNISREAALAGIRQAINWDDSDQREAGVEVLVAFGLYELLSDFSSETQLRRDEALATVYIEGLLLGEGDIVQAGQLLIDPQKLSLDPKMRSFWRAVLAEQRGDATARSELLQEALSYSSPKDWPALERVAQRAMNKAALTEFYSESFRRWPASSTVVRKYLDHMYSQSEEGELARGIGQVNLAFLDRMPYEQMRAIYLKALFKEDLPMCRFYAEKLVAQHPTDSNFYITLGFVYAQSGYPGLARRLLAKLPVKNYISQAPANLRIAYAVGMQTPGVVDNLNAFQLSREKEIVEKLRTTALVPGA